MTVFALGLVLLQAAAVTPSPAPSPTPRPSTTGPRTLQDVARERKLAGASRGKGTLGTISGTPAASSAPVATPEPGAEPSATPTPEAPSGASVRVTTVANDGIVDNVGGVRVSGTVRNAGSNPACNVVITVRIMDSRGDYLSSGQASPDTTVIPPGEVVSFRTVVQAPPGVRGARAERNRKDVSEGSTTYAGEWKVLGGTEANVASASEDCPK